LAVEVKAPTNLERQVAARTKTHILRRGTAGAQVPGTKRTEEDTDGHQGAVL